MTEDSYARTTVFIIKEMLYSKLYRALGKTLGRGSIHFFQLLYYLPKKMQSHTDTMFAIKLTHGKKRPSKNCSVYRSYLLYTAHAYTKHQQSTFVVNSSFPLFKKKNEYIWNL